MDGGNRHSPREYLLHNRNITLKSSRWNTSEIRRQEVLKIHDALDDLGLDQLHTTVHILVTGGTKTPLKIIGPMVNTLTHTVLESLPMLARLRMKLRQWDDCLERAVERRIADREKRKVMEERAQAAKQPLVYKQFNRVISNFGGSSRRPATPAARSRPLSTISNATPPSTPPGSRPSTADPSAADKGAKETFHVESGVKISWIPFHETDPRYHDKAFIEIHRDGRRPRTMYVSLVSRGEGDEKRTSIHVRVGGGWMEFEGWFRGFLEHGRA